MMPRTPSILAATAGLVICLTPGLGGEVGALAHQQADSFRDHLKRGEKALHQNNLRLAKKELKEATSIQKNAPEPYLLPAHVHRLERKPKDAFKLVKQAIKLRPQFAQAHYFLAQLYYEKGDRAAAHEEVQIALHHDPQLAAAHRLKGDLFFSQSKYELALDSYQHALKYASDTDHTVPALRSQVEALKSYVECRGRPGDAASTRPVPLNLPTPSYTPEARWAQVSGTVRLLVLVDKQGRVGSTIILSGLGYGLNEQAVRAVRAMKFKPATKDGVPVACWVPAEVQFSLR